MCGARPAISFSLNRILPLSIGYMDVDEVEDGRLAGAVRADKTHDLFLSHLEVEVGDDVQTAEVLVDFGEGEEGISSRHGLPPG